jgi:hypothetical protein
MSRRHDAEAAPSRSASAAYALLLVCLLCAGSLLLAQGALAALPKVEHLGVTDIGNTSATFEATVNPEGEGTAYRFEYASQAQYEDSGWAAAAAVPASVSGVGNGVAPVPVLQEATGLILGTAYRVRLVATNSSGTTAGEAAVFATHPTPLEGLPDGRAYEQASPVDKGGLNANGSGETIQAAADGAGITFLVDAALPQSSGGQDFGVFLAQRGAENWSTQGLLPPASTGSQGKAIGLSEDGKYSFVTTKAPGPANPLALQLRVNATGVLEEMVPELSSPSIVAASADASVVAFETKSALAPGAVNNKMDVYVWDRDSRTVRLASTLDTGVPPTNQGSFGGAYNWWSNAVSTTKGGAERTFYTQQQHILSSDGRRLLFTAGQKPASEGEVQIYMRQNPTAEQSSLDGAGNCTEAEKGCTIQVSEANEGVVDANGPQPAILLGATPDGSAVFFMSSASLTADATTGPGDEGSDLYRFRPSAPAGERLTDLSVDDNPLDPAGAEVKGLLGYSGDGSYVYFAAAGALPGSGAPESDCEGDGVFTTGTCNVYMWHSGESHPTFVTQIDASYESDLDNWSPAAHGASNSESTQTARVAPDGGALVFTSARSVTGYDNDGPHCVNESNGGFPELGPGPCTEIYRYVPGSVGSTCLSCAPGGRPPLGAGASLNDGGLIPAGQPSTKPIVLRRSISADGDRVFFNSSDPLVSGDVNGDAGCPPVQEFGSTKLQTRCQDVYEWQAAGSSASCPSFVGEAGCVHLISPGTSPQPSFFADNDESGDNAFFFTAEQLVGQDKDALLDVYDARVGGGLAAQNVQTPAPCLGEACRGPLAPAPAGAEPGSASYNGPGNSPAGQKKAKKKHHKKRAKHHRRKGKKHHKNNHTKKNHKRAGARQGRGR